MSQTVSPSTVRSYGLAGLARVECFARRRVALFQGNAIACDRRRPGPTGPCRDADLTDHVRREIEASDFHGEG
jgi:putative transposase